VSKNLNNNFQRIDDLLNSINQVENVIVLGSAPSLRKINLKKRNTFKIAIGDLPFRLRNPHNIDLWVTANTEFPNLWNDRHLAMLKRLPIKRILLSTISMNDGPRDTELFKKRLADINNEKFFFYDQRHSRNEYCKPKSNCCELKECTNIKNNIQEYIKNKFGAETAQYSNGSTVALHAFALAICLEPKNILIAGIELPTSNSQYKYINNYSKIDRKVSQNIIFQIRKIRNKNKDKHSPFGGEEEKTLKEDFIKLFKLAQFLEIDISIISESKRLDNYLIESKK